MLAGLGGLAVLNGLVLVGNAGANTLVGTAFADVLMGGAGNDTLDGGAGIDTASYADIAAAVTVNLGLTKAQATGGAGNAMLRNIENVTGGSGNDLLTGNAVANRLAGGAGADVLWGGTGADLFLFSAMADSGIAARDTIQDFSHAEGDRIDAITGGKDQAFTFAAAFSHKAGELVVLAEGDHYSVQGDVNGDGIADLAISVYSATALVAGDFVL